MIVLNHVQAVCTHPHTRTHTHTQTNTHTHTTLQWHKLVFFLILLTV